MDTLSHRGRTIAYETSGQGDEPPLLYVHGAGAARTAWRRQLQLVDERPAVAMDLSGHGDSEDVDADPGFETLSAYADDVLAVAEAVEAGVLVGHSLGGAVLQHLAIERPDELDADGLVLTNTGARLAVLETLRDWLAEDFDRAVEFLHQPGHLYYEPDDATIEQSRTVMRATGRAVTERDFCTCHEFDVRDSVHEIDVPTLVLVGEHDKLTPPWFSEFLVEELPDAALAIVESAAHLPQIEQPEAFDAAVQRFLRSLDE